MRDQFARALRVRKSTLHGPQIHSNAAVPNIKLKKVIVPQTQSSRRRIRSAIGRPSTSSTAVPARIRRSSKSRPAGLRELPARRRKIAHNAPPTIHAPITAIDPTLDDNRCSPWNSSSVEVISANTPSKSAPMISPQMTDPISTATATLDRSDRPCCSNRTRPVIGARNATVKMAQTDAGTTIPMMTS